MIPLIRVRDSIGELDSLKQRKWDVNECGLMTWGRALSEQDPQEDCHLDPWSLFFLTPEHGSYILSLILENSEMDL